VLTARQMHAAKNPKLGCAPNSPRAMPSRVGGDTGRPVVAKVPLVAHLARVPLVAGLDGTVA
jgi:hypothetical protein